MVTGEVRAAGLKESEGLEDEEAPRIKVKKPSSGLYDTLYL